MKNDIDAKLLEIAYVVGNLRIDINPKYDLYVMIEQYKMIYDKWEECDQDKYNGYITEFLNDKDTVAWIKDLLK